MTRFDLKPKNEKELLSGLMHGGWHVEVTGGSYKIYDHVTVSWFSKWADEHVSIVCQVIGRSFTPDNAIISLKVRVATASMNEVRMRLKRMY